MVFLNYNFYILLHFNTLSCHDLSIYSRSQLELAIKQLQQIESHRRSLEAVSATSSEFLNDVDVNKRLDEVESTLLKLSYEINDCHTVELDKLLSSYEALVSKFFTNQDSIFVIFDSYTTLLFIARR